jgi:hypothetical protein
LARSLASFSAAVSAVGGALDAATPAAALVLPPPAPAALALTTALVEEEAGALRDAVVSAL